MISYRSARVVIWYEHWPEGKRENHGKYQCCLCPGADRTRHPPSPHVKSGTLLVEPTCSVAFRHDLLFEGVRVRHVAIVWHLQNYGNSAVLVYNASRNRSQHSIVFEYIFSATAYICRRDSSVTIWKSLAVPGLGNRSSISRRSKRFFSFSKHPQRLWNLPSLLVNWQWRLFLQSKAAGSWTWPPIST